MLWKQLMNTKQIISRMSKDMRLKRETRPAIKKALKKVESSVRADKTKEGVVQFRIEQDDLEKLYELSEKYRKPLGAMVREWVLERIKDEATTPNASFENTVLDRLNCLKSDMDKKFEDLEIQVHRIAER